ncbi:MAG: DUF47 domain-containing protein [Bacteroidales bacterium]|jgi:predicted phosphate transport protein (TIGR00153 family)|nr:DUF47 domain-containing protein [Bacteroidales bacterium]
MKLNQFFSFLVPKEGKFYSLLNQQADLLLEATEHLLVFATAANWEDRERIYKQIKLCETNADKITHTIFSELNKTFITPFDREDIHLLASTMDDVMDYVDSSIKQCILYKPKTFTNFIVDICNLTHQTAQCLHTAFHLLPQINKSTEKLLAACTKVNEIENKTDDLYENFLLELFENEKNPIELIKRKEIMSSLEEAIDCAEDVTDIIKSIIVKLA